MNRSAKRKLTLQIWQPGLHIPNVPFHPRGSPDGSIGGEEKPSTGDADPGFVFVRLREARIVIGVRHGKQNTDIIYCVLFGLEMLFGHIFPI